MKKSDLYGFYGMNLGLVHSQVEEALGICLEARESGYYGGDYYLLKGDDISLVLQENFVEDDGELTEDDYPDASILLYVNATAELADKYRKLLVNKLENVSLLKSENY
ncbi:MAG: hypothetical protein AB2745_03225 [Candidatus Thiodiazotropha endolucinida]